MTPEKIITTSTLYNLPTFPNCVLPRKPLERISFQITQADALTLRLGEL